MGGKASFNKPLLFHIAQKSLHWFELFHRIASRGSYPLSVIGYIESGDLVDGAFLTIPQDKSINFLLLFLPLLRRQSGKKGECCLFQTQNLPFVTHPLLFYHMLGFFDRAKPAWILGFARGKILGKQQRASACLLFPVKQASGCDL